MGKKITKEQFRQIIKEEAMKLNRRTILENEKKRLVEELKLISEEQWEDNFGVDPRVTEPNYVDDYGVSHAPGSYPHEYEDVDIYSMKKASGEKIFKKKAREIENARKPFEKLFNETAAKYGVDSIKMDGGSEALNISDDVMAFLTGIFEHQVGPDEMANWSYYGQWDIGGKKWSEWRGRRFVPSEENPGTGHYVDNEFDEKAWMNFTNEFNAKIEPHKDKIKKIIEEEKDLSGTYLIVHHSAGNIQGKIANDSDYKYYDGYITPVKTFKNDDEGDDVTTIFKLTPSRSGGYY